jgi:hypothetical protein
MKGTWKTDEKLPVGVSLSARRQIEVMTAKLGSTPERNLPFPCERHLPAYDQAFFRGESIDAPAATVFQALRQRTAASALQDETAAGPPAAGPAVLGCFEVVEIEADRQITVRLRRAEGLAALLNDAAVTFLVVPRAAASCRLLVKALVRYRSGWRRRLLRLAAPLVQFELRRELFAVKRLAAELPRRPGHIGGDSEAP